MALLETSYGVTNSTGRAETLAETWIERLQQETRYDARWSALLRRLSSLSYMVGVVLLLLLVLHTPSGWPSEWVSSPLLFGSLLFGLLGLQAQWVHRLRKERQQRLIHQLKQEIRTVGPLLLLMYPGQEHGLLQTAAQVLKEHLPHLQAADSAHLTPPQREALNFLLQSSDSEMVLVTLRTLKQVGDGSAIRPVKILIQYTNKIHVHAEARRCLVCLQERAEALERAQTLLRPAALSEVTSEMLLRPVAEGTVIAQEQLLRSTQ